MNEKLDFSHLVRVKQLILSLKEKIKILNCLDNEIIYMVKADKVADEIKHSDKLKAGIHNALVRSTVHWP